MRHRLLTAAAITLGTAWVLWESRIPEVSPGLDNLVLISIDTLRADHVSAYGAPPSQTPSLDALAREGVVINAAMTAAPTTLASHASLLTGRWPSAHGVPRNGFVLDASVPTLAEYLRDHGFHTSGFVGATPLSHSTGIGRGFDHYDDVRATGHADRSAAAVNRAVLRHLDRTRANRQFLFVHYYDVHTPYGAPDGRIDDPEAVRKAAALTSHDVGGFAHVREVRKKLAASAPDAALHERALATLYRAGVRYADAKLGELLYALRQRGLLERSVILVTADHGETMNRPEERWDHGYTVVEDTIHVPMLLRIPGQTQTGQRIDGVVSLVDVMPTVCELLGLAQPQTDGRSFAPALHGQPLTERPPAFAEATKPWGRPAPGQWANAPLPKAARQGDHKVIWNPRRGTLQGVDVPTGAARAPRADLERALRTWAAGAAPPPSVRIEDAVENAQLEALGYIQEP